MKKWSKRFLVLFLFAALGGVVFYFLTRPKPLTVSVAQVSRGAIEATVVNTKAGTVKACRRAQLSPAIGGQIAELPVREGMTVKKDDLLLALWNKDIRDELTMARSESASASARSDAACLQADLAARQADRYLRLKESNAVASEQLDQATSTAQMRQAECEAARASTRASGDRIKTIEAALEKTMLRAPFAGVIADLNGELGEFLTPSPLGVRTLPAVDLIDTSCYFVVAPIDEVDAPLIRVGMQARITLDAFKGRVFAGKVQRLGDHVLDMEKQARTVEIEVAFEVPAEETGLLAGYSADTEVILEVRPDVLRVPTEALTEKQQVFLFHPDTGTLEERVIETGLSNWEYTEVVSGLSGNDTVVVSIEQKGLADKARAQVENGTTHE